MSKKLILFDFDGTIADSYPIFLSFASREGFHFSEGEAGELRDLSMREVIEKLNIPAWRLPFFARRFHRYFRKAAQEVRLIDGIPSAIRKLNEEGYILGVVTTNSASNVRTVLRREELLSCFEYVFSERSIFGKARMFGRIVRRLGIPSETVWYVGDEVRDVEAAREAGLQSIAVTWGFNSDTALRAARPNRLASHPDELPDLLWER